MVICKDPDCKVRAYFNDTGETKGLYCVSHKKEGMIYVRIRSKVNNRKKCIHNGCDIQPCFNIEGETKGLYCFAHKLDGMINVYDKICIHDGCKIPARYNINGENEKLYCVKHKLDGMVNKKNNLCIHEGCGITAHYNIEGKKKKLYCVKHKLDGMVITNRILCNQIGCKKQPTYNYKEQKKGLYCAEHKLDGMINVIDHLCIYEGCTTHPSYNKEGETIKLYCLLHKKEGMINLKTKTCKNDWCTTTISNTKYDGYCLPCYMHMFPDKPVARNYKTKEASVSEYIKAKYSQFEWITDRRIPDGCSRRRPDLLLDLGYQVIIIEIDENQHTDYDCTCENKRTMELSQDVGHRAIVFIRFNPDDYVDGDKKVTSCWGLNKLGICNVKKTKKKEWTERLHALSSQVDYWVDEKNKTDKTVEIVQLFYDR